MITGALKTRVDQLWDAFWSGGISNPLEVIEQITYLIFIRRLDDLQANRERRARHTGDVEMVYSTSEEHLRWRNLVNLNSETMFKTVQEKVFPWLRQLGSDGSTIATFMRDARFTIPSPNLLTRAVGMIAELPVDRGDTKGDLYEYMLSKIATSGQNGQFRTPRHIIALMVEMMAPTVDDIICDPACGTAGFLVGSAAYVADRHQDALLETRHRKHFDHEMFHGFDFDGTMLRIGSMNMLLHDVDQPDIRYRDSLSQPTESSDAGHYSLVLANPPFAGSLDHESVATDLRRVGTKKTELLFLALFLRLLRPGGRAAVIVPEGVLFGSTKAHRDLRRDLVEEHKLDAVVKLPSGVFKPYAGVSTAILFFTRTDCGGTDYVWFYDVAADGFSLDDKRTPLLPDDKLGPTPRVPLTDAEHTRNNLPDVLARWTRRDGQERGRAHTEQSFCVPKAAIAAQSYDLSLNRYKESVRQETSHRTPAEILDELDRLEGDIQQGMSELRAMLG